MKIIQINLVCHVGSTGKICDAIAQHLIRQGHDVLNCSVEGEFQYDYEYKYETRVEALYRRICFKLVGRKQWQTYTQTKRLIRKIREFKPNIVHVHNIHHNVVNMQMLFDELAKQEIPIVYTMHDMWPMTGGCFHDFVLGCFGKDETCNKCRMSLGDYADCSAKEAENFLKKKKTLYEKQKRICFVMVSEWLKQGACNSIIANYQQHVIRNGINISRFKKYDNFENELKKLCGDKKIVLSCASYWMDRKGLFDFISLARILGEEYQIVLIGHCDEEIKRKIESIIFIDNVNDESKLAQFYSQADVYVSMSKCETFGLTLAEAACCGIPIVGYDNSGMSEVIHIAGGICVPNGNVRQMAEKIQEICANPVKKDDAELEKVRQNFSILEMCEAYEELYRTII